MYVFAALILAALTAGANPVSTPGDRAFTAGAFDDAARAYAAALAKNPHDADALLGLGTVELYRNHLTAARKALEAAHREAPNDPTVARRLLTLADREGAPGDYAISMGADIAHLPFVRTDPLPVVRASVNGRPVALLIDTGGANIDLTDTAAKRLGLPVTSGGTGVFAGGRTAQMRTTRIPHFEAGGVRVDGIPGNVIPGPMDVGGTAVDGVIGTAFLAHFLASIDYARGELTLRPRSDSRAFLAALPSNASIAPMWLAGDHFIFTRAAVDGTPEAIFNVDTGGEGVGVQLSKAQLDAAHIAPDTRSPQTFEGGGGATRALPFTARVRFGSMVREVPGLYFPDGDQYGIFPFTVGGTLSHVFFRRSTLTLDFQSMTLIAVPGVGRS